MCPLPLLHSVVLGRPKLKSFQHMWKIFKPNVAQGPARAPVPVRVRRTKQECASGFEDHRDDSTDGLVSPAARARDRGVSPALGSGVAAPDASSSTPGNATGSGGRVKGTASAVKDSVAVRGTAVAAAAVKDSVAVGAGAGAASAAAAVVKGGVGAGSGVGVRVGNKAGNGGSSLKRKAATPPEANEIHIDSESEEEAAVLTSGRHGGDSARRQNLKTPSGARADDKDKRRRQ